MTGFGLLDALVLPIAVFCLVLLRMLCIFTYPLNNAGGDTSNYYFMLVNGTTSLTHASGYPYLVGSIASFIDGFSELSSPIKAFAFLVIQHSIDVLVLSMAAFAVRRMFNVVTALIFLVLAGYSVFAMSWTSATYPEWLQSCALLTTLLLVAGALSSRSPVSKFALYSLSLLTFAWAYLTKYNSGALFPLFLIPLVVEFRGRGRKAAWLLLTPLPAILSVYLFVVNIHFPSSRTTSLHHDTAWVLMAGLNSIDRGRNVLLDDPGPYALRWLAMSSVLPPLYDRAHDWRRVDETPRQGEEEIAKKYRAEYDRLNKLDDSELKRFLDEHPLPQGFRLDVSAIPFYEFLGLEEGDSLGTKVFIEYIWRHPLTFAWSTIQKTFSKVLTDSAYSLVPNSRDALVNLTGDKLASGFALYKSTLPGHRVRYQSDADMIFWEPGMTLLGKLDQMRPARAFEFICSALSIIWAIVVTVRQRRLTLGPGLVFTLALAISAVVVATNMILWLRDKEIRALWPLVSLFWAIGIGAIIQHCLSWLRERMRRPARDTTGNRATRELEPK